MDDLVGAAEIADSLDVAHRETVHVWRRRYPDFPEPVAELRQALIWSWPDVEASADWDDSQMNLVIHEFAHKIDMTDGDANGCPPLPDGRARREWQRVLRDAYADFTARVDDREDTAIDPYAAENPGEFFAVLSEVFFVEPQDGGWLAQRIVS